MKFSQTMARNFRLFLLYVIVTFTKLYFTPPSHPEKKRELKIFHPVSKMIFKIHKQGSYYTIIVKKNLLSLRQELFCCSITNSKNKYLKFFQSFVNGLLDGND